MTPGGHSDEVIRDLFTSEITSVLNTGLVSADEMLLMSDCHLFHGSLLGRSGELKRWNKRKI